MKTLAILFAGHQSTATLIDGSPVTVFVRAMPQRWLARVAACAEFQTALVELCCYVKAESAEPRAESTDSHPEIPPPAGYAAVPEGWTDNLSDESVGRLYEEAKLLNFQRAIDWAAGQIAAKKLVAPLHEQAMNQVLPLAFKVMEPLMKRLDALSASMPSAPSSAGTPGKLS